MQTNTYMIQLEHFEGPFDLLLFFIQRDELDIYDIPIAKITTDFLGFIREMKTMNIELASEFIVVAATLMRIKAKMLLPRRAVNEEGEEIDPREELVARLLEYKQYKEAIVELRTMEEKRNNIFKRGNVLNELQIQANQALVDIELKNLTLFNLFRAFQKVMERHNQPKKPIHTIVKYNYTIRNQQRAILLRFQSQDRPSFDDLFDHLDNRIHAIVQFLALLELANQLILQLLTGHETNQLWVVKGEAFDQRDVLLSSASEEE